MALWTCTNCTAAYSVGAPQCPHCGATEHIEEGQDMPKITRHEGPSIAGVTGAWSEGETPEAWPAEEEGGEESSPGSSSETSPKKPPSGSETSDPETPSPARTTASRSRKGRTGSSSAGSTDGAPETGTSETNDESEGS